MSGPTKTASSNSHDDESVVRRIRESSGVEPGEGPSNKQLLAAVEGFKGQFDYWYTRVMREAVPKYRKLIIRRINPFIRRIEFDGLTASAAASRLVQDYRNRNFVTAGGWALEKMAVRVCTDGHKSPTRGIDLQRYDAESDTYYLHVIKSGTVTRNSDILQALKDHSRAAESRFKQGGAEVTVVPTYSIAAGRTASTHIDGISRPSSGEFWGQIMGLDQDAAIDLALVIAREAGHQADVDASRHVAALELLVGDYIAKRDDAELIDWDHVSDVTMRVKSIWKDEDERRHERAMSRLKASGYNVEKELQRVSEEEIEAAAEIQEEKS